jgi:hypothetical protein
MPYTQPVERHSPNMITKYKGWDRVAHVDAREQKQPRKLAMYGSWRSTKRSFT